MGHTAEIRATSSGTEKIMSPVRPSCSTLPPTEQRNRRSSRSGSSSGVTSHGPVGPKPGNDFPSENCGTGPAS